MRLVRPLVGEKSVSFRLRFRFVRAVRAERAGEARSPGRMTIVVLIAGPPWCEYGAVCARFFAFSGCLNSFVVVICMGFEVSPTFVLHSCMGFERHPLKTT